MKQLNQHTWTTESDEGRYILRKLVKTNTAGYQKVYDQGDRYVVETQGEEEAASFKAKNDAMKFIKAGQKADAAKAKSATGGTATKDPVKEAVHGGKKDEASGDPEGDSADETTDVDAAKLKKVLSSVKKEDAKKTDGK